VVTAPRRSEPPGSLEPAGHPEPFVDLDPGHSSVGPTAAETHLSVVLFAGTRAYKLYKPVDTGFVDATTPDRRLDLCRREVDLNRRFAPDVYLGVVHLGDDDGTVHDHAVVMRRLPAERRLARLLGTDEGPDRLREVAKRIAAIHAAAPRLDAGAARAAASPEAVLRNWRDNIAALAPLAGTVVPAVEFERVRDLAERYLTGAAPLFEQRIDRGMIVDGHGDLLAEDIFCLGDGPRILDCLAFDDRLRHGDVLADLAFLVMDVERLGGIEPALALVRCYHEFTDEQHPGSLAHHYVAYRASVRAKVAAIRLAQGDPDAAVAVADHHRRCHAHLERARVRLVLIGGAPATGKSTLAAQLGQIAEWTVLRSDEIRRELEGRPATVGAEPTPPPEAVGTGRYRPEAVDRVYSALLERAGRLARLGQSVILDASWIDARRRAQARAVARDAGADVVELCCDAPTELVRRRIESRIAAGTDPSEATVEVAEVLRARLDPWPEALLVDTSVPLDRVVRTAADHAR
jgi:aminoglycoside phosphotransferase family enzyme/predicted kinase